ncbi:hypothetical protein EJB05_08277, partial [Eragrostis curvula]
MRMRYQEVTPHISGIFQRSRWWKEYPYGFISQQSEHNATRQFFCMLRSKLPLRNEEIPRRGDRSSVLIDGLAVQASHPNMGERRYVGFPRDGINLLTCCLTGPTRANIRGVERRLEAVGMLNHEFLNGRSDNVIVGGDMNWDEDLDGPFPFTPENGWVDAWTTALRMTEPGWTIDTKANPMLQLQHGNKPVQKRPDRFLCKLKHFTLESIEMIGRDEIRGVDYYEDSGRRLEELRSSHHFGLVLTISGCATFGAA